MRVCFRYQLEENVSFFKNDDTKLFGKDLVLIVFNYFYL